MKLIKEESHDVTHWIFEDGDTRLPFSAVVRAGNLLFVSGQASVGDDGQIIPGTFEEEFRRTFANVEALLVAAGSGLDRIIQIRSYIRDAENGPLYNRLYREIFSAPFPARTTITNCLPETIHYEVECIALAGDAS